MLPHHHSRETHIDPSDFYRQVKRDSANIHHKSRIEIKYINHCGLFSGLDSLWTRGLEHDPDFDMELGILWCSMTVTWWKLWSYGRTSLNFVALWIPQWKLFFTSPVLTFLIKVIKKDIYLSEQDIGSFFCSLSIAVQTHMNPSDFYRQVKIDS